MPNRRWILAFGASLICAWATKLLAGNARFTVKTFGAQEGLRSSVVLTMTQTRDGYLWVGTLQGLARFDGLRFTPIAESTTPGLSSSLIFNLFEDTRTNLWIGTENAGVLRVDKNGQLTSVQLGSGTRVGPLKAACEDRSGSVWLYTRDGQLCRYRDGKTDCRLVGGGRPSNCRALIAEDSGRLWVGTDLTLSSLNPTASSTNTLPEMANVIISQNPWLDFLLASKRGGYWRLANGRIDRCEGEQVRQFASYPWDQLSTPVTSACEDLEGNLVVGTYGDGIYWFDAEGKFAHLSTELSHSSVLSLVMDREGCLWVGTNGGGLNRVKRQVFDVLERSKGLTVQSVCEDAKGGLWLGYNGDRVDYYQTGITQQFGVVPENSPAYVKDVSYVKSIFADQQNRVLVGMSGLGPRLLHFDQGQFKPIPGFGEVNVSAIYQDRAGALWVGTENGLARLDQSGWKMFTRRDGLSAEKVRALVDDEDGNLWIGTEGGGFE
jgi:ligand-binding sensor domain-containing protein